jgi:hypothetical protein
LNVYFIFFRNFTQKKISKSAEAAEQFEYYETPFYKPAKELKDPEDACKINTNDNKNSAPTNKRPYFDLFLLLVILEKYKF